LDLPTTDELLADRIVKVALMLQCCVCRRRRLSVVCLM